MRKGTTFSRNRPAFLGMKWELIAMRKGTIRLAGTAPLFLESNLEVKKLHTTPERSLPRNW